MVDPLICFGGGFLFVGLVLDIISVASHEWMEYPDGSTSGLWATCLENNCIANRRTHTLDGVRAMMVMSVITSGIAFLAAALSIAYLYKKRLTRNWVTIFTSVFICFAIVLILIGIIVYHRHLWTEVASTTENLHHGYSYWLAVTATIIFFLAELFFLTSAAMFCRYGGNRPKQPETDADIFLTGVPYYNLQPVYVDNDAYFSKHPHDTVYSESKKSGLYPIEYDNNAYSTLRLPHGALGSGDNSDSKPVTDEAETGDYRIPRPTMTIKKWIWIA